MMMSDARQGVIGGRAFLEEAEFSESLKGEEQANERAGGRGGAVPLTPTCVVQTIAHKRYSAG